MIPYATLMIRLAGTDQQVRLDPDGWPDWKDLESATPIFWGKQENKILFYVCLTKIPVSLANYETKVVAP